MLEDLVEDEPEGQEAADLEFTDGEGSDVEMQAGDNDDLEDHEARHASADVAAVEERGPRESLGVEDLDVDDSGDGSDQGQEDAAEPSGDSKGPDEEVDINMEIQPAAPVIKKPRAAVAKVSCLSASTPYTCTSRGTLYNARLGFAKCPVLLNVVWCIESRIVNDSVMLCICMHIAVWSFGLDRSDQS